MRIAVDSEQASQHSNNITASHQEIQSAASRVNITGTKGTLAGEFYSQFHSHVHQLSSQVGKLQEAVSQTVGSYDKAASSQVEHDTSVKSALTKITSVLEPSAKAPAPKRTTR